ncbi:MAG: acyl-CoA desaturase [Phycisphaerales bacterium]
MSSAAAHSDDRIHPFAVLPILVIHLLCAGVIWTGWSVTAVAVAAGLFLVRMFVITAFYHRYFSHRTFRTHRVTQFVFALIGASSAQRGPVWWAAHHRAHHRHSDREPDPHSPGLRGLLWSHTGWFLTGRGRRTDWKAVPDWAKFPELVWLEKYHLVGPLLLIGLLAGAGAALAAWMPGLGTSAAQLVIWGFAISTSLLYHATFTINSLAHTIGSQRFRTGDDSRNNWFLALLTLGEGWHNNHHYFPGSARQGFYWWEIDLTYYLLRVMERLGLVWRLRPVPAHVYETARRHAAEIAAAAAPGTAPARFAPEARP